MPQTIQGRVLAGIASITGVILIAMPISLLAKNYEIVYTSKARKERILAIHNTRRFRSNQNEKPIEIEINDQRPNTQ